MGRSNVDYFVCDACNHATQTAPSTVPPGWVHLVRTIDENTFSDQWACGAVCVATLLAVE